MAKKRKIKKIEQTDAVRYNPDPSIGLTSEQVEDRVYSSLANVVKEKKGSSIFKIVLKNLFTVFNVIYAVIAAYIIVTKTWQNLTFLAVIIPNIAIGIFQEIKAKLTIDKLSVVNAPKAEVIRDGKQITIETDEVVLDDIMVLKSGDQVYTDSEIISGVIEANEALLSGEAEAVVKTDGAELLAGSFIASGSCIAKAIRVGNENYIEKMAGAVKSHVAPKSELLKTLSLIIKVIGCLIPIMVFATYKAGWSNLSICSVVLAMIPAGLFLLTSVALFVGEINLAKKNTLVQELYCIEMLARVDCLCLDKTGTITDGTMRVVDSEEIKNPTDYTVREIIGSMLSAFTDTNATSTALERYFDKSDAIEAKSIIPFSSKRKYSAVTFKDPDKKFAPLGTFILGASEFVLKENLNKVKAKVSGYAKEGYRVIVLGFTKSKVTEDAPLPRDVTPVALIALQDHIRDDAFETIEYFNNNGVEIRVISGDDPETVSEIAKRAGIENADLYINLEGMNDEEVADIASDYYIFGRVTPEQKQIIIRSLQAKGKTCAMTGDGVNDILALREADCSIAMASGADAARYASHLVLLDSNFSSLPSVVSEGRRVINNIQRTSSLFLTKTFFGILLTLIYILLQFITKNTYEYPFKEPSMMMLIETVTIGIPATILALQPSNEKISGRFLVNVIKTIAPAVFTIIFYHIALFFIAPLFNMSEDVYTTISVIMTNIVCLFVLFKVARPFNWWKVLMICLVTVIVAIGYILSMFNDFVNSFVHATNILEGNLENILLLVCLALSTYYVYTFFKGVFKARNK